LVGSQSGRVIGVRITTANREDPLREKIPQQMINLANLPRITQTAGHPCDQSVATLGCFQQHRTTIGTALPLVELKHQRLGKNLWKQ